MVAFAPGSERLLKHLPRARAQRTYVSSEACGTFKSSTAHHLATDHQAEDVRLVTCSRDPIGYEGGDANLYPYVSGTPVLAIDPSGLKIAVPDIRDKEYIEGLLNELCPGGDFKVGPDGDILTNRNPKLDPTKGCSYMGPGFEPDYDSDFPVSCGCLDSAVSSDTEIIIKRARVGIGGIIGGVKPRPVTTRDPRTGVITVAVNQPRTDVGVRTPDYIVLGHELCGHALTGLEHPTDPSGRIDPAIFDPVIAIENDIRREHDPELGQRSKF